MVTTAAFCTAVSAQQTPSISGVVHRVGGQPIPHVEVRVEGAGAAVTSDSGEFVLAMTANLHVGMPAVFHVKDWVILKPCENKMGRAYLRDPSAEPIEFLVLALDDPRLKSPKTKEAMEMIECLLVEESSQFSSKPKAAARPRSSLEYEWNPVFTGRGEKEYARADLKSDHQSGHQSDDGETHYRLIATAYHPTVSQSRSELPSEEPNPTADTPKEEFLARKAKELGFSVEDLKLAIDEWGKSADDPYRKGLAALHELRYAEASQYIAASIPPTPGEFLERYVPLARAEYEQGHYPAAETALRKVLAVHGDDPVVLNNLALTLSAQAKYSEAEPLMKQAIANNEAVLGPDDPSLATDLNNLGTLYYSRGKYSDAEDQFRRALAINKNTFGPDYPASATIFNNLGQLYEAEDDTMMATSSYWKSLAIAKKAGAPDSPELATTLGNLGQCLLYWQGYLVQDNVKQGQEMLTRALAIDEKTLGPDHPGVATDLARLGFLYYAQGKPDDGEPLFKRALAIDEKALGPDHPEVASLLNNWGLLYYYQGKFIEAEPLFKRCLAIYEKALGPDHPNVALAADNLAKTLSKLGRDPEAQVYEQQAAAIRAAIRARRKQ